MHWKFFFASRLKIFKYENSTKIRRLCDCQNSNKFAKNLGKYYMIFQTTIIILHYFIQGRSSQKNTSNNLKRVGYGSTGFMANYVWIFFLSKMRGGGIFVLLSHQKYFFLDFCIYSINLQYDNHNVSSSFFCLLFDNLFSDDEIFLFRNKYEYLQIWWRWAAKIPNEMTRHFSSFSTLTSMFCQQTWFAYVPTSYYKKKCPKWALICRVHF